MIEEVRSSEATMNQMLYSATDRPGTATTLGVALGIPIVRDESVAEGKMQLWRDGELVREFDVRT